MALSHKSATGASTISAKHWITERVGPGLGEQWDEATHGPDALLAAALRYAEAGWHVFPVQPLGKAPLTATGFKQASTNPNFIRAWWAETPHANIGVACGASGLAVVDLDEKAGLKQWDELSLCEATPDTLTIRTPRAGRHLVYSGSMDGTQHSLASKIDTRSRGGYILTEPSYVAQPARVILATNGKPARTIPEIDGGYVVEQDLPVAPLPDWIREKVDNRKQATVRDTAANVADDLPVNVARAVKRLHDIGPVRQGDGADHKTLAIACEMRDLGLSPEQALATMLEHYDCQPQDERYEAFLQRKIENGFKYGTNAPGVDALVSAPSETFKEAAAKIIEASPTHDPVPFASLMGRSVPPVRELIPGLIERGIVTFLAGPGGVHKSRLGLQWGLSLAAGVPVFDRKTERCTFVALSYEDHPDEITRRTQAISRRLDIEPAHMRAEYWDLTMDGPPLANVTESGVVPTAFRDQLRDHLKSIPGHKFVLLDSAYNALAFEGQAKINETSVKAGIAFLSQLCRETDSTMLVLWHPSQAGQERGDASGWSVAWHNAPRARLSLSAIDKDPDAFNLKVEKRNNARKGATVTLRYQDGTLAPMTAIDLADQDRVLIDAVVRYATSAAAKGRPIAKLGIVETWIIDMVEKDAGRRLPDKDLRKALDLAMRAGRLRYRRRHNSTDGPTGYYPFAETDPNLGQDVEVADLTRDTSAGMVH